MHILITGSAGFVGSHLVERFLDEGHGVVGVDSYLSGRRSNTARFAGRPGFTFIEADVSREIPPQAQPLDWVLHFASPASPPHYQSVPIDTLRVGARGTENALSLAREHGASFMLASTSEVYGDPLVHPQPEGYWGHVNSVGPRACYDEAKRYAEAITMTYHHHYGLDVRIARIFNTYGPRMRPDDGRVVTNFVVQALRHVPLTVFGDGAQTRSFQYVDDLVEGIVRLMRTAHPSPVNLGNPEEYPIESFARIVRDAIDPGLAIHYLPRPVDDPERRRPDVTLARRLLDWSPRVPLVEGLTRTIDDFRSQLAAETAVPATVGADRAASAAR